MKKEPLSIITVKTLLAVIIFTGVGTIIVGGGWLIGNYEKVSEPTRKDIIVVNNETKTKDETADWKVYQNKECGFEIKYPQSFYIERGDYNIGDQYRKLWIQLADSKWKNQMVHNPSLIIDLIKINLSAKEYLNKTGSSKSMLDETCPAGSTYCSVKDVKDISIGTDEIFALQFYSAAVSGSDYHTIIKNNGFLIDIRKHSSGIGDFPEDIYNQILSTFKFIDQDETTNWKTYRNEKYKFEVKYPENLKAKQPVSDVFIVYAPNEKEYLQIQRLATTPPLKYSPNGAKEISKTIIGKKEATKYYTENPVGEGVLNFPFTKYVIVLGDKEWIYMQYYGENEVSDLFEKILSTFKFIEN